MVLVISIVHNGLLAIQIECILEFGKLLDIIHRVTPHAENRELIVRYPHKISYY